MGPNQPIFMDIYRIFTKLVDYLPIIKIENSNYNPKKHHLKEINSQKMVKNRF